ncbi:MAG: hypothetical protein Q9159_005074 [Coniocarpon cinnabarinum]
MATSQRSALSPVVEHIRAHPRLAMLGASHGALFLYVILRSIYQNYARWRNLGEGGLPANPLGWMIQWLFRPLGLHDMISLWPYSYPPYTSLHGAAAKRSYLKRPLPTRDEARPLVSEMWIAPQRQESGSAPVEEGVHEAQRRLLDELVADSKSLRIGTSRQEARGPALWLAEGLQPPKWARWTRGECAHVHLDSDWSGHVSLSPADAAEVVSKGWGQRHMLSQWFHIGFTFIYAPRTKEQMDVVREVYEASCRCMVEEAQTEKFMGSGVSPHTLRFLRCLAERPCPCSARSRLLHNTPSNSSGHSKWATIKHDKVKADTRKNKARNIYARDIVNTTRLHGADPKLNAKLATAISNARSTGMSKQSIEAALQRGQGKTADGKPFEPLLVEAMFPGTKPVAMMVEGDFENKALALQEIRLMLKKGGARETPALYAFKRRGRVVLDRRIHEDDDAIIDEAMEVEGCLDINHDDKDRLVIDTEPEALKDMESMLVHHLGVGLEKVETVWHPNEDTTVEDLGEEQQQEIEALAEKLEDFPGVQKVWTNVNEEALRYPFRIV